MGVARWKHMPDDLKLAEDEARRRAQHEKVKEQVLGGVGAEIQRDAERIAPAERQKAEQVTHDLKRKAIDEVKETESEIRRGRAVARFSQVVDYVFYVIFGLIGLQIFLELIGARERAGFKQLMNSITSPLLGPFRGLVMDPAAGPFQLMLSYLVGLIVYILLHMAIRGLLRVMASRRTVL